MSYNGTVVTTADTPVNGKTGAIVLNLDSDPIEAWFTPDITALSCNGSGGSGTTNPKWNGVCTSDPSIAGTGASTGHAYPVGNLFIPGYGAYPVWSGLNADVATFSFATDSTLAGYLPAGYAAWNTAGGAQPADWNPQIANAPRYSNGATMTQGNAGAHTKASRIVGGPGCAKAGYTNGSNYPDR